ncbi:hypothetical protein [Saccharothrix lopnurensis]|uniref:Uncharacterized protein n=1 Tax=Saccharothrix lopnurensis TaxID=1670621 RepID=A0ABW1NZP9_9PSEU
MTAITMTHPQGPTAGAEFPTTAPALTRQLTDALPAGVTTAARFLGHFTTALLGVALLGRDLEH